MSRHVALLRAVNVVGNNRVGMADLRQMFEDIGFAGARTLILSGNVVFDGGRKSGASLEALLEKETASRLGLKVDVMVRSASELRAAIEKNPFVEEAKADPGHLLVMFMRTAPTAEAVTALSAAIKGREEVKVAGGREAYVTYPDGIGRSKLTTLLLERSLGSRGTGRNWNTVLKLAAMVE
jgi:uncharacterized protein (DUF1697 family)